MELELKNQKGEVIGTMEFPVEQLKESLNLSDSSKSEDEAKLAEVQEQLGQKDIRIAQLEEEVVTLQSPETKAAWLENFLTPENFAVVAVKLGYELLEASETEVAEAEEPEETLEEEPEAILMGKTEKSGYKYLSALDISVLEEKA